jgi:hypothetical protein
LVSRSVSHVSPGVHAAWRTALSPPHEITREGVSSTLTRDTNIW